MCPSLDEITGLTRHTAPTYVEGRHKVTAIRCNNMDWISISLVKFMKGLRNTKYVSSLNACIYVHTIYW
jgi:hypothetical protein